jgi:hypothetical protein
MRVVAGVSGSKYCAQCVQFKREIDEQAPVQLSRSAVNGIVTEVWDQKKKRKTSEAMVVRNRRNEAGTD